MDRYLEQLRYDFAVLRLKRAAELEAEGKLHIQGIMTGHVLDAAGAAGADAASILEGSLTTEHQATSVDRPWNTDLEAVDDFHHQVELYLSGLPEGTPSLAEAIGIDIASLPPPAHLSEAQASSLLDELLPLLAAFGNTRTAPARFPRLDHYRLVVEHLAKPGRTVMGGVLSSDGCTGNQVGCDWGAYCNCLQYERKEDFVARGGNPAYPDEHFFQGEGKPFSYRSVEED